MHMYFSLKKKKERKKSYIIYMLENSNTPKLKKKIATCFMEIYISQK